MNGKLRISLSSLFALILIGSLTSIIVTDVDYRRAQEIYEDSRNESFHVSPETEKTAGAAVPDMPETYFPEVCVDFAALTEKNPDVVGWLWIPDTTISFPLLRSGDNSKYLTLSYDLQRSSSGSIFMDYRNSTLFKDDNTVIYGHNMKNGSMFGRLKDFAEADFLSEHCDLYIFTADTTFKYRIFAACTTEADSESYTRTFSNGSGFFGFIDYIKNCPGVNLTEPPATDTPLLTLSTCTSGSRRTRFVVQACLIAEKGRTAELQEASLSGSGTFA